MRKLSKARREAFVTAIKESLAQAKAGVPSLSEPCGVCRVAETIHADGPCEACPVFPALPLNVYGERNCRELRDDIAFPTVQSVRRRAVRLVNKIIKSLQE